MIADILNNLWPKQNRYRFSFIFFGISFVFLKIVGLGHRIPKKSWICFCWIFICIHSHGKIARVKIKLFNFSWQVSVYATKKLGKLYKIIIGWVCALWNKSNWMFNRNNCLNIGKFWLKFYFYDRIYQTWIKFWHFRKTNYKFLTNPHKCWADKTSMDASMLNLFIYYAILIQMNTWLFGKPAPPHHYVITFKTWTMLTGVALLSVK